MPTKENHIGEKRLAQQDTEQEWLAESIEVFECSAWQEGQYDLFNSS